MPRIAEATPAETIRTFLQLLKEGRRVPSNRTVLERLGKSSLPTVNKQLQSFFDSIDPDGLSLLPPSVPEPAVEAFLQFWGAAEKAADARLQGARDRASAEVAEAKAAQAVAESAAARALGAQMTAEALAGERAAALEVLSRQLEELKSELAQRQERIEALGRELAQERREAQVRLDRQAELGAQREAALEARISQQQAQLKREEERSDAQEAHWQMELDRVRRSAEQARLDALAREERLNQELELARQQRRGLEQRLSEAERLRMEKEVQVEGLQAQLQRLEESLDGERRAHQAAQAEALAEKRRLESRVEELIAQRARAWVSAIEQTRALYVDTALGEADRTKAVHALLAQGGPSAPHDQE